LLALLREVAEWVRAEALICDRQYSSRRVRGFIDDLGAEPVISISEEPDARNRGSFKG
jgi:hypothetical protein